MDHNHAERHQLIMHLQLFGVFVVFIGDAENDPWEWREIIARSGEVVYGKFFGKKTGFVSKEWFPVFANYRRDGYDFDARWDDELANIRNKRIMDWIALRVHLPATTRNTSDCN